MGIKGVKKSSLTKVCLLDKPVNRQTCIKTLYTNLSNCLLHNLTFRLVTHSGSNTPLRARQKTEPFKLHNGHWCRMCAPYGYVPLSHVGNIVLTNEIATFHNGGISSSNKMCHVNNLLQKIIEKCFIIVFIPNNSALIYLFNMLPKRSYICILK